MQIPVKWIMPWKDDASQKVFGRNISASKGFFPSQSALHIACTINHLVGIL